MSIQGVDRKNRVIRGVSLITRGESLGHDSWNDLQFLAEVAQSAQSLEPTGVKSRFRHPGMCSDGLGSYLGQIHNVRMLNDQVVGDLYISPAADESPEGELGSYAMTMAEQAPESFGLSIVFEPGEKIKPNSEGGIYDERNVRGLPHERLSRLIACDVVDTPAANPFGLFANVPDLQERAAPVLLYAFGFSHDAPIKQLGAGIHPKGLRNWMTKFLSENQLQVSRIEEKEAAPMAADKIEDPKDSPEYKAGYEAGQKAAAAAALMSPPPEEELEEEHEEEEQMGEKQDPASIEELSALPGATPQFILGQLIAKATLLSAQAALLKELHEQVSKPSRRSASVEPVQTPAAVGAPADPLDTCRAEVRKKYSRASDDEIEARALNMLMRTNPNAYHALRGNSRR